jgi:photosystem II stability/assembly factor-like uncharacterized protein
MKKIFFNLFFLLKLIECNAQAGSWQVLPNSPNQGSYRHDDVFFLNDSIGWIVNNLGKIYRTNDGGNSWIQQFNHPSAYFRCVGFADTLNGWVGNLGAQSWGSATDTNCLYQTHDGGLTWNVVTNITGPKPMGLCGIYVFDSLHIYATGRIEGPVHFIKSSDGGNSWQSQDMSAYCGDLVDVKFFSADTGFIVGGTDADFNLSHGVILKTVDGGNTWQTIYTSVQDSTWCWKQTWPSINTGYISLQRMNGPVYFLKTIDGGTTWSENLLTNSDYFCQGIGFLNDSTGWIGGSFINNNSFQTNDGGITWSIVNMGHPINRFRFTSDSTGYCAGQRIYRYSPVTTGIPSDINAGEGYSFTLLSSNPAKQSATVEFFISSKQNIDIGLYDLPGRRVKTIFHNSISKGRHRVTFDIPGSVNGIFFCSFASGQFEKIIPIVRAK